MLRSNIRIARRTTAGKYVRSGNSRFGNDLQAVAETEAGSERAPKHAIFGAVCPGARVENKLPALDPQVVSVGRRPPQPSVLGDLTAGGLSNLYITERDRHGAALTFENAGIQYRTENLRIVPVFGKAALEVSPRVGHLHDYVDDQSWPIVDTSGETVVLVGLPPGPHKVQLELADTIHRPIPGASATVEFIVPAPKPKN